MRSDVPELTCRARDMHEPWADWASNKVVCRGEPLRKVIRLGRQWAVTKYGLECRDGSYAIPSARVWEDDWVEHMADKDWVDLDDFVETLRVARWWARMNKALRRESALQR